jgi:hypothetical protein
MKRSKARIVVRLALIPLALLLVGFSANRFRPHAQPRPRTPFCYANVTTAQGIAHSAISVVPPAASYSRVTVLASSVLNFPPDDQAMLGEVILPSSLRAPPIIRI